MDPLTLESAALSADGRSLVILDQTLLPGEVKYLSLTETEDSVEAIRALRVRGAPAIGVAADTASAPEAVSPSQNLVPGLTHTVISGR